MSSSPHSIPLADICAQIKRSGYAQFQVVRMYGEEFEILSDPFPHETGVAIRVRSRRTAQERALQLPAMLVNRCNEMPAKAA